MNKEEKIIQMWLDKQFDLITLPNKQISNNNSGEPLRSKDLTMFADLSGCVDIKDLFVDNIAEVPSGL